MSGNQTNWIFNLVDQITAPLKNIIKNVTGVGVEFDKLDNSELSGLNTKLETLNKKLNDTKIISERLELKEEIKKTEIEVEKLTTELKKTNTAGEKTETIFDKIGKSALNFNQITNAITSFSDGLSTLTQNSETFEFSMAKANTMANLGTEEFEALTSQVKALSKEVPIARDLLGDGLYQVISQGVPESNWLEFLEQSSKSSIGGVADLSEVVKVTSTVIKNYGLEWDKATDIQDKIQKTAQLGSTSFEELASALPSVSGSAALLNVDINELFASFSTLTGVSGNTSEVATQLQGVFAALIGPTSQATDEAEAMGLAFDALSIEKAGGMLPFLQDLSEKVEAYSKKSGKASETIYATLFGSTEARKAILSLTGELADDFVSKTELMANSAGTIETAYAQMADTSINRTQKIQNVIDNFKDSIFNLTKDWMPFIKLGSDQLVVISQMAPALSLLKSGFTSIVPAIAKMGLTIISGLVPSLGSAITAQTGLNVAMAANPIGAIVAGILLWIAAITAIIVYFEDLQNWFERQAGIVKILIGLWSLLFLPIVAIVALARLIIKNWDGIVSFFQSIPEKIKTSFVKLKTWFLDFFGELKELILKYHPFAVLLTALDDIFPGLKAKIYDVWLQIKENLIDPIKNAVENIFKWLFEGKQQAPEKAVAKEGEDETTEILKTEKEILSKNTIVANQDAIFPKGTLDLGSSTDKTSTTANSTISTDNSKKSVTMNLDIKNYFSIGAENLDNFTQKIKAIVTDVIVDAGRDASIIISS